MPNWCECKLVVRSARPETIDFIEELVRRHGPRQPQGLDWRDLLAKRLRLVVAQARGLQSRGVARKDVLLLEHFCPMPEALRVQAELVEGNGWKGEEPEWRKWRVDHWGSAYEPLGIDSTRTTAGEIALHFETPWAAPLRAIRSGAARLDFDFRLTSWDGESVGWATNHDEGNLICSLERLPEEQGIPRDIIEDFDLRGLYEAHRDGKI
jgi:hypothetical protein